jgi:hypothetical protein
LTPLIETVVAFVVVQLSVDDCPVVIVDGFAANDPMTTAGAIGLTVTVAVAVLVPPTPVAVNV